jgi:hypothetical protein
MAERTSYEECSVNGAFGDKRWQPFSNRSLSRTEVGWMQATSISVGEEGKEMFLDIPSDRTH